MKTLVKGAPLRCLGGGVLLIYKCVFRGHTQTHTICNGQSLVVVVCTRGVSLTIPLFKVQTCTASESKVGDQRVIQVTQLVGDNGLSVKKWQGSKQGKFRLILKF